MRALRSFVAEFELPARMVGWPVTTLMATCVFLHWRMFPSLGRLLPVAYDGVYVVIPLAFAAAAVPTTRVARPAFALALALCAGPLFWAKWQGLPKSWATADPASLVVPVALGAVVALASAARARLDLDAWMLGAGDWRWWAPRLGVAMAVVLPAAALSVVFSPSLQDYYPSDPAARGSLGELFVAQLGRGAGLFGEEFFWHGFMLAALARLYGAPAALVITSFGYFAVHKTKPELEMASSWVGAMLLGAACLRCRSFWPAFLGHWPMNLVVELTAFGLAGPR
jgi:membrane protease YdiL (CAAX protease family)